VENIIIEPFGMNTAPCIALSIAYLKKRYDGNINLLVLPADHVIKKTHAFLSAIELAELPAQAGKLVTFGIIPDYPATGYGYIESGEELYSGVHSVQRFKEKPDLKTAESFLAQGNFFWNSGMFYWTLETIWEALTLHQPAMIEVLGKIVSKWHQQGWTADIDEEYRLMPRMPIDIAIMEPAANRVVIPVDIGWSDVGSWKALADISATDEEGNSFLGPAFSIDSGSNYIRTGKFTALIGVQNLCVVETANSILITTKDRAEEVKKVVDYLAANQKDELL
jgi:mannose-1-phosphate guanylyltransferase